MIIPIETLSVFVGAVVTLALAPGPDNIFVLTHSALHGRLAGLFITLGLCTGVVFHTVAIGLGVAAIFAASELAFSALKMFGVLYLVYLAWVYLRANAMASGGENGELSARNLYIRGVIMNLSNPKVAIFFLAFLPQFTDPVMGNLINQIMILGIIFTTVTCLVFGSLAWFSGVFGERFWKAKLPQRLMSRFAGLIFLALAFQLVFVER